jgi:hypothetical protein
VPHGHRLAARRRRFGQFWQMCQYGIVQAERALAIKHAYSQGRHGLRHREHITANIIDPATLAMNTVVGNDMNGISMPSWRASAASQNWSSAASSPIAGSYRPTLLDRRV